MNEQKDIALAEITAAYQGQQVQVCGTIADQRLIVTKGQETVCLLVLEDQGGSTIQTVVVPPIYQPSSALYARGTEVVLTGRVDVRQKTINVFCSSIRAAGDPVPTQQQHTLDAAERYLFQVQRDLRLPGLAVGIVQDGKVIFLRGSGSAPWPGSNAPDTLCARIN